MNILFCGADDEVKLCITINSSRIRSQNVTNYVRELLTHIGDFRQNLFRQHRIQNHIENGQKNIHITKNVYAVIALYAIHCSMQKAHRYEYKSQGERDIIIALHH